MPLSSKLRHLHRNDTAGPPLSLPHHEGFFVLAVPLPQAKAGKQRKMHSLCRYKALRTDAQINLHFFCQMRWITIGTMSKSMHSDYTDFGRVWKTTRINALKGRDMDQAGENISCTARGLVPPGSIDMNGITWLL